MAVSALTKIAGTYMEVCEGKYDDLVRQSEQLRVLKNFVALEDVYCKDQVKTLIKAMDMEANNE